MRASEALSLSYGSLGRMREIEAALEVMRGRVGGTSHGMGIKIDRNIILDPMRMADQLIEHEADMEREAALCKMDVDEARAVCRGAADVIGPSAARALELHFCDGLDAHTIALRLGYPREAVDVLLEDGPATLDACEYGRLLERGRRMVA